MLIKQRFLLEEQAKHGPGNPNTIRWCTSLIYVGVWTRVLFIPIEAKLADAWLPASLSPLRHVLRGGCKGEAMMSEAIWSTPHPRFGTTEGSCHSSGQVTRVPTSPIAWSRWSSASLVLKGRWAPLRQQLWGILSLLLRLSSPLLSIKAFSWVMWSEIEGPDDTSVVATVQTLH